MPAYAPAALGLAVALSAIGAVALCVLIMLYGFTPAGEEPPGETSRRLLATRIGHALAAVCFAGTATLITIVLVRTIASAPAVPVAVPAATAAPATVVDERIPDLGAKISGQEMRLSEAEARMQRLEREVREREATRAPAPEPAPAPAAPNRRVTPKPSGPTSAVVPDHAPAATTTRVSATSSVEKSSPVEKSASSEKSASPEKSASAEKSSPTAPVFATPSASPRTETSPPAWGTAPVTAPPAPAASLASGPHTSAVPAPPGVPATSAAPTRATRPQSFDLKTKLRDDWRAIRRSAESAPDDFRRAMEETKRNLGIGN